MIRDTASSYGLFSRLFHWVMALLVIGMIALGLWMTSIETPSPTMFSAYKWHKQLGMIVLFLAVLRVLWRLGNPVPLLLGSLKSWQKFLARLTHFFFYGCFFIMPLTGWMMSSGKGFSVSFFGITLPNLIAPNKELANILEKIHEFTAFALIGFIGLHVAAALKHHFILKDKTLKRMIGLTSFLIFISFSFPVFAQNWFILKDQSKIGLSGTQMGAKFSGQFDQYKADIFFDPNALEKTNIHVEIDLSSINTQNPDRDQTVQTKPWFDIKNFPIAVFKSNKAEQLDDGSFVLSGDLTIKGITQKIELPFTFQKKGEGLSQIASVQSSGLIINRLNFNLGAVNWQDASTIGHNFPIALTLVAKNSFPE